MMHKTRELKKVYFELHQLQKNREPVSKPVVAWWRFGGVRQPELPMWIELNREQEQDRDFAAFTAKELAFWSNKNRQLQKQSEARRRSLEDQETAHRDPAEHAENKQAWKDYRKERRVMIAERESRMRVQEAEEKRKQKVRDKYRRKLEEEKDEKRRYASQRATGEKSNRANGLDDRCQDFGTWICERGTGGVSSITHGNQKMFVR